MHRTTSADQFKCRVQLTVIWTVYHAIHLTPKKHILGVQITQSPLRLHYSGMHVYPDQLRLRYRSFTETAQSTRSVWSTQTCLSTQVLYSAYGATSSYGVHYIFWCPLHVTVPTVAYGATTDYNVHFSLWRPLQLTVPNTTRNSHFSSQWSLQFMVVASVLGGIFSSRLYFSSRCSLQLAEVTSAYGGQLGLGRSTRLRVVNSAYGDHLSLRLKKKTSYGYSLQSKYNTAYAQQSRKAYGVSLRSKNKIAYAQHGRTTYGLTAYEYLDCTTQPTAQAGQTAHKTQTWKTISNSTKQNTNPCPTPGPSSSASAALRTYSKPAIAQLSLNSQQTLASFPY
ncbi:leucine aminopeptidase 1-like [Dorcoceras hygrometricum]|uniref:Leucine aminopeptidase 1-like n=1 Tax=Dorcoceras hygrometricum TaxID=472368 RepID=A0A2Z7DDB5_9LAMI|nr:leucine aminopeptidase 1-like [Dorcoceras hygrometricum]